MEVAHKQRTCANTHQVIDFELCGWMTKFFCCIHVHMKILQSETGEVWMMVGERVVMYINKQGALHFPNDIVCFAQLPKPPENIKAWSLPCDKK